MGYGLMATSTLDEDIAPGLIPGLDITCILRARGFDTSVTPRDFYVGATAAIPQIHNKTPANINDVPVNSVFIDMGTAFSPTRFMGQGNEIRYARALLHLRAAKYREGREIMIKVMNFLLGKKLYVHPGAPANPRLPHKLDDPDPRVVWHELKVANLTKSGKITSLRYIAEADTTRLEYLDVYTTSSEPIHTGPDARKNHFFTTTYNMVYIRNKAVP